MDRVQIETTITRSTDIPVQLYHSIVDSKTVDEKSSVSLITHEPHFTTSSHSRQSHILGSLPTETQTRHRYRHTDSKKEGEE